MIKTTKRTLTILLAVLMIFGLLATAALGNQSHPFTDLPSNPYGHDSVQFLWERGIMQGTSSTQFSPHSTLTRAMVATILHRVAGEPQTTFSNVFTDVPNGRGYSVPIVWAQENGVVQGVGGGRFAPNDTLTREQLLAMMHRYAVSRGFDVSVPANVQAHENTSGWAREYARWGVHNGFLHHTWSPNANASRIDTAIFIHRFMIHYGLAQPIGDIDTLTRNGATWRELHNQGFSRRDIQDAFDREMIRLVNNLRRSYGLPEFIVNATLGNVARLRAEEDTRYGVHPIPHTSHTTGLAFTDHFNAMTGLNIEFAGENLGAGTMNPQQTLNMWLNSPGHRNFIFVGHHSAGDWVAFTGITQIGVGMDFNMTHPINPYNHAVWALWLSTDDIDAGPHTVTFDFGFDNQRQVVNNVAHGTTPTPPTIPSRQGWQFITWWPEIGPVRQDTTFTAIWEPVQIPTVTARFVFNVPNFAHIDHNVNVCKIGNNPVSQRRY